MSSLSDAIFFLVVLVALLEGAAALSWFKPYYLFGIPLFRRVISVTRVGPCLPQPERIQHLLHKQQRLVIFRSLAPDSFAFREKRTSFFSLHYVHVLHGRLQFHPDSATVSVTGLANWFSLLFTLFMAMAFLQYREPLFLVALAAALSISYFMQRVIYSQVAEAAAEAWSSIPTNPDGA